MSTIDFSKPNPATNKPWTAADMQTYIGQLEKQNQELALKNTRDIRMFVAEGKGGIMLTGVNAKFPVSLHYGQWVRVFAFLNLAETVTVDGIVLPKKLAEFAARHKALLSDKDDTEAVKASKLALRKASTDAEVSHAKEKTTK